MILAIIAGLEAMTYCAFRSRRGQARKQQLLTGTSPDLHRAVPLIDNYLRQKTARTTRFQRFFVSKLAALCRRVVHTRSFEYLLLHLVRTAILNRRSKVLNMKRRVTS